jgi:hypothetical protein
MLVLPCHWLDGTGVGIEGLGCLTPLSTIFQLYHAWQSVLLVEEAGVSGENHWHAASHWHFIT